MSSLASRLSSPAPWREALDRDRAVLITHLVAFATGVSAREIAAVGRVSVPASEARALAMYLAHTGLGWPLARVGTAFGRDRTTVGHACQRIEARRDDPAFDASVAELEACLGAAPAKPGLLR